MDRMSMGQRHGVRIALTFLHRPKLVLLDEPSTASMTKAALCSSRLSRNTSGSGAGAVVLAGGDGPGAPSSGGCGSSPASSRSRERRPASRRGKRSR